MGIDLYISRSDPGHRSIHVSRFFYHSLLSAIDGSNSRFNFAGVLTREEVEAIRPNELGEVIVGMKHHKRPGCLAWIKMFRRMRANIEATSFEDPFEHLVEYSDKIEDRQRDPVKLKAVLSKLHEYIRLNPDMFPLWHRVYRNREDLDQDKPLDESVPIFEDKDIEVRIQGTVHYMDEYPQVREKIVVRTYQKGEPRTLLKTEFIPVAPEMTIHDVPVFTRSLNMEAMTSYDFQLIFGLLDEAIAEGSGILWEFG